MTLAPTTPCLRRSQPRAAASSCPICAASAQRASAPSFDNPDFVDVTIQSYRHRFGNAPGDPALETIEQRLAARPTISVPTIALHGEANGVGPPETSAAHARFFTGPYQRRVIARAGHNLPQEVPDAVTAAALELIRAT